MSLVVMIVGGLLYTVTLAVCTYVYVCMYIFGCMRQISCWLQINQFNNSSIDKYINGCLIAAMQKTVSKQRSLSGILKTSSRLSLMLKPVSERLQ